jgi:acetylornithine deacetylase/succinyl-diaminopimelate desuccinylase-like protein
MKTAHYDNAIQLLQQLIASPSFSKKENETAAILYRFLRQEGVQVHRQLNNVWAIHNSYDAAKPTVLLNSHHDTVLPNPQYQLDPFQPQIIDGKLYGLGSNDAGGSLVSLIAAFLHFSKQPNLPWNIVVAATAEEEISGRNGIEALLKDADFLSITKQATDHPFANWSAIVGEPTQMQLAVAEKGLLVLDAVATGKAGHAAREEGVNALYIALQDINWFKNYQFEKLSSTLGAVKMSVTTIETENKAHNMVPAFCRFTVDIRVTDSYSHEEILAQVQQAVQSTITARSMRMRATGIALSHPLVAAGLSLGASAYGSPTSSDKALIPFPALKIGVGDSARSHTADEFIYLSEIEEGIEGYIKLIDTMFKIVNGEQ